ncbi:sensor histidine kinase [Rhodococcus sp. BH5]|uniref:sensor histidine kinase n=1 Tax=Rhodococcus sp. BH5 TaxID=2871702 RepID=UPI0022CDA68E|nr:HAMP domain-containing sensor histidine kinase [Rhodococcus sp. BH5]MCZ9635177.1 HAMP domain-containing histidine kinase [Rhodococcus sp. BH5]
MLVTGWQWERAEMSRSVGPLSRSIRARVTLGALAIVAVVLGVGSVVTVQILSRTLTAGVATAVERDLDTIAEQLEEGLPTLWAIGDDVLVRLDGARPIMNDDEAAELPALSEGTSSRVRLDGDAYFVASEETTHGVLMVARPLEHVEEAVTTSTRLLAVGAPLLLALVGGVVWVVAGRALAPVERLRRQVDEIDANDLARRVEAASDDELGRLAATMNGMLDRIRHAQLTQRRFVSDASHELRSPLATIRQHAEVAAVHPASTSLESLSGVVIDEGARMQELVEGLLLLARLDEGQRRVRAPVDLDDLALIEARRLRGLGVTVDTQGIGPGRVVGDESLLARAVRNLADNAARHAAGTVTLRVVAFGLLVRVAVEDDGDGVPAQERDRVFERFARLDEGRAREEGGSGLGLAIVREIARSHGGSVTVGEGAAGGALFVLALPAVLPD